MDAMKASERDQQMSIASAEMSRAIGKVLERYDLTDWEAVAAIDSAASRMIAGIAKYARRAERE